MRLLLGILGSLVLLGVWMVPQAGFLLLPPPPAMLVPVAAVLLFVLIHWRLAVARKPRRASDTLRLRPPHGVVGLLVIGILVYEVFEKAFYVLYTYLLPLPSEQPFRHLMDYVDQPLGWLPVAALAVVSAPVIEETVFRGWIQRPLERRLGPAPAIALAALLFSLSHLIPELLLYYIVVGVILGFAVYATGSLWAGIALHGVTNAVSLLLLWLGFTPPRVEELAADPVILASVVVVFIVSSTLLFVIGIRILQQARPDDP